MKKVIDENGKFYPEYFFKFYEHLDNASPSQWIEEFFNRNEEFSKDFKRFCDAKSKQEMRKINNDIYNKYQVAINFGYFQKNYGKNTFLHFVTFPVNAYRLVAERGEEKAAEIIHEARVKSKDLLKSSDIAPNWQPISKLGTGESLKEFLNGLSLNLENGHYYPSKDCLLFSVSLNHNDRIITSILEGIKNLIKAHNKSKKSRFSEWKFPMMVYDLKVKYKRKWKDITKILSSIDKSYADDSYPDRIAYHKACKQYKIAKRLISEGYKTLI